jgi:NADH:ubiquinone oxidoreductase subunit 3 (subunit A)
MLTFYSEYFNILVFTFISIIIASILLILSYAISPKSINMEKLSTYECGFEPFDEARKSFDIQFFLIGVLFLVFDLEIAFLLPWAVTLNRIGLFGFWTMILFFYLLTIGFIYEWQRGALDWSFNFKE